MDAPATTTEATPPQANEPAKKPGRKPLDEEGRAAAASRAVARKLAKKLSVAKSADEFWEIADELAKKNGRAPVVVAQGEEKKDAGPDPLDVPQAPGWPTPRQMIKVQPFALGGIEALAKATKGTRYDVLNDTFQLGELEISRKMILAEPVTACAALAAGDKAPEMHPVTALALATAFVFGPPAVMHAWEVFGPRVKAWWAGKPNALPQAEPSRGARGDEEKNGPKLVKAKGGA